MKAVPTTYNGVNYRSKLEAQWAAFFDEMEWEHEYEPFEINGRVPDFIIYCNSRHYPVNQMIVEVKPEVYMTDQYINDRCKIYNTYRAHTLFLTERPFWEDTEFGGGYAIGKGQQFTGDDKESSPKTEIHPLIMKPMDIGSMYMWYDAMINPNECRKDFVTTPHEAAHYQDLFTRCKNTIQFKY